MIWVIANKVEEDGSFPTYRFYRTAFADDFIDICCATEKTDFSFIKRHDIVIVRTRDQGINERLRAFQKAVGFKSTVESSRVDWLTHDKEAIKPVMDRLHIAFPKSVSWNDIVPGRKYFVKPRYGENSNGVDQYSVCSDMGQVYDKWEALTKNMIEPMIEEYIDGIEVTTAVIYDTRDGQIKTYSAVMKPNSGSDIHTSDTKQQYDFTPEKYDNIVLDADARIIFNEIGAKHILRIDSRIVNGTPYIIDVNMIPGLAPNGYISKCMEMHGISYLDFIRMMVFSAY